MTFQPNLRTAVILAKIVAAAPLVTLERPTRPDTKAYFLSTVARRLMDLGYDAQVDESVPGVTSVLISPLMNDVPPRLSIMLRENAWLLELADHTGQLLTPNQVVAGFSQRVNFASPDDHPSEAEVARAVNAMGTVSKITDHFCQWVIANRNRDFPVASDEARRARDAAFTQSMRNSWSEAIRRPPAAAA